MLPFLIRLLTRSKTVLVSFGFLNVQRTTFIKLAQDYRARLQPCMILIGWFHALKPDFFHASVRSTSLLLRYISSPDE